MLSVLAIAVALGQVPDAVTQTGTDLLKQGGYQAVTVVLAVVAAALAWACWKLYGAVRDLSAKLLELALKQTDTAAQQVGSMREISTALGALQQEVRARAASV
jgi:uncharacterized membrane protein YciS (DUF1049 family)